MIPLMTEDENDVIEMKKAHIYSLEECVFCSTLTNLWHENTNNPICLSCAKTHKVADIQEDHGQNIRKQKRLGTFKRGNSVRAN